MFIKLCKFSDMYFFLLISPALPKILFTNSRFKTDGASGDVGYLWWTGLPCRNGEIVLYSERQR